MILTIQKNIENHSIMTKNDPISIFSIILLISAFLWPSFKKDAFSYHFPMFLYNQNMILAFFWWMKWPKFEWNRWKTQINPTELEHMATNDRVNTKDALQTVVYAKVCPVNTNNLQQIP